MKKVFFSTVLLSMFLGGQNVFAMESQEDDRRPPIRNFNTNKNVDETIDEIEKLANSGDLLQGDNLENFLKKASKLCESGDSDIISDTKGLYLAALTKTKGLAVIQRLAQEGDLFAIEVLDSQREGKAE